MKDKGTGAENLVWLAGRKSGRPDASLLAADDILAALTERIAELEARVSEILAEVDPESSRADSKRGGAPSAPKADAGRGTEKMGRDARVEADDDLTRASEERRMLANEMRLLREAFQEARRSQLPGGPGAGAVEPRIAPDFRSAFADEMRSLLTELLADFRARPATPPPVVDQMPATTEVVEDVVVDAPILVPLVQDAATASPPAELAPTEVASIDAFESVIEHVDELQRLPPTEPIVDEYVEDLRASRRPKPAAPPRVDAVAPEPATPIVDAYIEELHVPDSIELVEVEDVIETPPEPPPPIVDESVLQAPEVAEPIIDERLQALLAFEAPPDLIESSAPRPEATAPIIDELVFEPPQASEPTLYQPIEEQLAPESALPSEGVESSIHPADPIEPIVDEYVSPAPQAWDPAADERLEALRSFEPPSDPEKFEWSALPANVTEPIVEEFIEESQPPESALPFEAADTSAAPAPIVEEFVEEPRQLEQPIDPIADIASAEPVAETQILPPSLPSTPDARIDALWNAASSWSKAAEIETPPSFEAASFVPEESVPQTHSLEVPEAQADTWAEPVPETPTESAALPQMELAPPPPMEFAPLPPMEFTPDASSSPAPALRSDPPHVESAPQSFATMFPELRVADERGLHQIQIVISPIHSFPRLLETERRIRALSTVNALHLRDYRNGVATLTVSVGEAISPAEFGAVIQMLEELHLRLDGTTQSSVELRAEEEPPSL